VSPKKRSFWRKIAYLAVIAVLLGLLSWLGRPSTTGTDRHQGSPGGVLAQLREKEQLSQTGLGQIDPAGETIKLATLGLRGIAANILWEKANRYKMKKDWTNLSATLEQITRLQPNFISVWRFQAWNLAYNVSAEFDDFRERYRWVIRGIDFLKGGIKYNQREPRLLWDVGWFISQKIGRSDERKQFRRLFKADDDFHGDRPVALRDNWLVGKEWFERAEELVDSLGVTMKGMSPLIFRSDAPMCQMNYAEALETDGTFGEVARGAWIGAAKEWDRYGSVDIPTSYGVNIRLSEQERFEKIAKELVEKLEALQPGLREKIIQEKRAKLTDAQREALATPLKDRAEDQHKLAAEATEALKVTNELLARRITGPKRKEALELAKEATEAQQRADVIRRYRQVVNYTYWGDRAKIEQENDTLSARKLIYQGDQALAEADLTAARDFYDRGLATWRKVLDRFPVLIEDNTFGSDMIEVIGRYRRILDQLDDPFPKNFILQDVIDRHGASG